MTSWLFTTDEEDWSVSPATAFVWDAAGYTSGCLFGDNVSSSDSTSVAVSPEVPGTTGGNISFRYRVQNPVGTFTLTLSIQTILGSVEAVYNSATGDSGWLVAASTLSATGTIDGVGFALDFGGGEGTADVRIDNIYFDEAEPSGDPELRYLGLAADRSRLYITYNEGGTLYCRSLWLDDLAEFADVSRGAASLGDVDSGVYALKPATRGNTDQSVILFGRDGSNIAVQVSTDGGATFTALDDVGWATSKVCVALLPSAINSDDWISAFGDDDVYRTLDSGTTWTKTGDAPGTLRAAARHETDTTELMLAETAADTMQITCNLSVSHTDVSDSSLNTIYCIEASHER